MPIFAQDLIGIDLGSSTTTVYVDGLGVCLREPTQLLVSKEDIHQVAAIGEDAARLADRVPDNIITMPPIRDTAVTDVDLAALMLLAMSEKAAGRKKPAEKGKLLVNAPCGLSHVEHDALLAAAKLTGAKRIASVNSAIAAAVGADIDIMDELPTLLVDLGGGSTEISVIASGRVIASRTVRTAGMNFDGAIIRHLRASRGISIGSRTAEEIKKTVGSALLPPEGSNGDESKIRGRDLKSGKPIEITVNAREIDTAIQGCVDIMIGCIQDVLLHLPAEYAADIKKKGMYLTGGCALLAGLSEAINIRTELPVTITRTPQDDVASGLGIIGRDERLIKELVNLGSASE